MKCCQLTCLAVRESIDAEHMSKMFADNLFIFRSCVVISICCDNSILRLFLWSSLGGEWQHMTKLRENCGRCLLIQKRSALPRDPTCLLTFNRNHNLPPDLNQSVAVASTELQMGCELNCHTQVVCIHNTQAPENLELINVGF